MRRLFLLLLLFLVACTPQTSSSDLEESPHLFNLYATSATEAWVPQMYACAERSPFGLVARTPNINSADISLHIGSAERGYQIDEIELFVIANAQNEIEKLNRETIIAIFSGKVNNWSALGGEDAPIQLWVYGKGNELQDAFDESLPEVGRISTLARQAQNESAMREAIAQDAYAIGIGTQAEEGANLRILYSLGKFPVLALVKEEPQEIVFSLISCLQGE